MKTNADLSAAISNPLAKSLACLLCLAPFQANAGDWTYTGEIYRWGPKMTMTTPTGIDAEIPFYQ